MREDKAANEEREKTKRNYLVMFAKYSQVAFALPAATVVGWLAGAALDRWLHTQWIYLVGLVLGATAGIIELIRLVNAESKQ